MKIIDEQIQWYEQNSDSLYDDLVRINLNKINDLYDVCGYDFDELFVHEMIETFCKIIETQRSKIEDLEMEAACASRNSSQGLQNSNNAVGGFSQMGKQSFGHRYIPMEAVNSEGIPWDPEYVYDAPEGGFENDKQLQEVFTSYCLRNGKSSYTVNDYCSRIKNLWKSFYDEFCSGEERIGPALELPYILKDGALLNVYENIYTLREYVDMKISVSEGNRNWANTRAALKKLDEFKSRVEESN